MTSAYNAFHPRIKVTHFQRRPFAGGFSVERLFEDVRHALPSDIEVRTRINRFLSRGVLGRLVDSLLAAARPRSIKHVLGDVHYIAWFLPRRLTILTILDCVSLERMTGVKLRVFWFLWYWWPMRRAGWVTVISEYTRESVLKWTRFPHERILVIPPPISAEFQPMPRPLRSDVLRLLHIGTGINKNLPRVIEAIRDLPVKLVIVGRLDRSHLELLRTYGIGYENYFDLSRPELLDQYRCADAVIFASTYEGFGLPIVEAQAVGRPLVTSAVCSMPEVAGEGACLVDPYDVSDIRRAIERLLTDEEFGDRLVALGRTNVVRFSLDRIARQYAELYRVVARELR